MPSREARESGGPLADTAAGLDRARVERRNKVVQLLGSSATSISSRTRSSFSAEESPCRQCATIRPTRPRRFRPRSRRNVRVVNLPKLDMTALHGGPEPGNPSLGSHGVRGATRRKQKRAPRVDVAAAFTVSSPIRWSCSRVRQLGDCPVGARERRLPIAASGCPPCTLIRHGRRELFGRRETGRCVRALLRSAARRSATPGLGYRPALTTRRPACATPAGEFGSDECYQQARAVRRPAGFALSIHHPSPTPHHPRAITPPITSSSHLTMSPCFRPSRVKATSLS